MRRIEDLQRDIETGVADLVAGEGWQHWLAVAARFPRYSLRNQLLIRHQRPNARIVMGYRAWQAHGHQVRRGEQSTASSPPAPTRPRRRSRRRTPTAKRQTSTTKRRTTSPAGSCAASASPTSSTSPRPTATPSNPPERPALLEGEAPGGLWDTLAARITAVKATAERVITTARSLLEEVGLAAFEPSATPEAVAA
jgi:hypothetical protein